MVTGAGAVEAAMRHSPQRLHPPRFELRCGLGTHLQTPHTIKPTTRLIDGGALGRAVQPCAPRNRPEYVRRPSSVSDGRRPIPDHDAVQLGSANQEGLAPVADPTLSHKAHAHTQEVVAPSPPARWDRSRPGRRLLAGDRPVRVRRVPRAPGPTPVWGGGWVRSPVPRRGRGRRSGGCPGGRGCPAGPGSVPAVLDIGTLETGVVLATSDVDGGDPADAVLFSGRGYRAG